MNFYRAYIYPARKLLLFTAVIGVGVVAQLSLWLSFPIADRLYWLADAQKISSGHTLTAQDITYPHPGTTYIYPIAGLIHIGVDGEKAMRTVLALFISLCITLSSIVAYKLRPQTFWWLAIIPILFFDLRFLHATPPSAAASALTILYFLLVWHAMEQGKKSLLPYAYAGFAGGILMATRIDTGLYVLATALPFLLFSGRWRAFVVLPAAIAIFFLCNPHTWVDPAGYLQSTVALYAANTSLVGIKILIPFLCTFPFALLSIALSLLIMSARFQNAGSANLQMPLAVYVWLACTTALITVLLAPLSYHPIRYFMPFYLIWDVLLPFWLFDLFGRFFPSQATHHITRRLELAVILIITLLFPFRLFLLLTGDTTEFIL